MEIKKSIHYKGKNEDSSFLVRLKSEIKAQDEEISSVVSRLEGIKKNQFHPNQNHIEKTLQQVKNEGMIFAAKLEEEKMKHNLLNILVKHFQQTIYQNKVARKEDKNLPTNELQTIEKKLKDKERYSADIVTKTNSAIYDTSKKEEEINVLRSQRTIFSGVFNQIQQQMFTLELNYKKILLERITIEKQLKQHEIRLNEIRKTAEQSFRRIEEEKEEQQSEKEEKQIEIMTFQKKQQEKKKHKVNFKNEEKKEKSSNQKEFDNVQYEVKVKQILHQLGVQHCYMVPDTVAQDVTTLQNQINSISEDIHSYQEKIKNLKEKKAIKLSTQTQKQSSKTSKTIKLIKELDQKEKQMKNTVMKFSQQIQGLFGREDELQENMIRMDEMIKTGFVHNKKRNKKEEGDEKKLNDILSMNRTSKVNTRIYSQAQFLTISKNNLQGIFNDLYQ